MAGTSEGLGLAAGRPHRHRPSAWHRLRERAGLLAPAIADGLEELLRLHDVGPRARRENDRPADAPVVEALVAQSLQRGEGPLAVARDALPLGLHHRVLRAG